MKSTSLLLIGAISLVTATSLSSPIGAASQSESDQARLTAAPDVASELHLFRVNDQELGNLTGAAPDWVDAVCVVAGGVGTGWAIVGYLAKRAAVTVACPACGVGLTVAGFACLLL